MAEKAGVEVYSRFYPWPEEFRLGDPVLVREVTGMDWPEFIGAMADQQESMREARETGGEAPDMDQVVLAGVIAVAFWQGNPQMSREKARRAIERCPQDRIEIVDGDGDEEDSEESPPAGTEEGGEEHSPSSRPSAVSPEDTVVMEAPPASTSDETNPNGSGSPGLPSQPRESLQA